MSKKSDAIHKRFGLGALIIGRGEGKLDTVRAQVGERNGKTLAAAALEVRDEFTVYPPATEEEARAFCRIQIKRCRVNLANAKERKDNRAVINLERKLAVYEYLYQSAKTNTPLKADVAFSESSINSIRLQSKHLNDPLVCRAHALNMKQMEPIPPNPEEQQGVSGLEFKPFCRFLCTKCDFWVINLGQKAPGKCPLCGAKLMKGARVAEEELFTGYDMDSMPGYPNIGEVVEEEEIEAPEGYTECPNCLTWSVNPRGYCACCGKTWFSGGGSDASN